MRLSVAGLSAAHRNIDVLTDVSLDVPAHALVCVVGPSGCGKTTLLRAIAGFHRPRTGTVQLGTRVLDDCAAALHLPAERRQIGYIPQDGALFPHLTVAGNIGFGLPRADRPRAVSRLLELIDLVDFADRHPYQLSGGQQQRVALARALAPEPDLLLLDEPFTALDAGLRARVRTEVTDLLRSTGITAILVTHDPEEALALADQVTIMDRGRVVQTGTPDELHAEPVTVAAARALGEANLLSCKMNGTEAMTALGSVRLTGSRPAGRGEVMVVIRPGQVVVSAEASAGTVAAQVVRAEFRGEDFRIELMAGDLAVPVTAHTRERFAVGSTAYVRVDGLAHVLRPD